MIKVAVVIPYPELHDKALKAARANARPGVECVLAHYYGTDVDSMDLGDADIILARGLTQQAIRRKHAGTAVLELTVSAYDILRAMRECRKTHGAKRIAIVGSDPIFYDIDSIREIVDADLQVFRIANETGILAVLDKAERDGFDALVGGLTACTLAMKRGWKTTFIRTSEETLQVSIKEAMNTANVMLNERAKAEISRSILENSKDAILYFDRDGRLAQFNRRIFEMLGLPPDETVRGLRADDLFGDPEIVELVNSAGEARGLVKNINRTLFVSDVSPVVVEGEPIGVICTFQLATEIRATENRIRKELHKKGLVAKYGFDDIIHASDGLAQTIRVAHKYAEVDANVLLVGETGTGKELFAQSIHNASQRRNDPFVAVNCAAFPENLLESELFGYVEGAFSGAVKGGTIGLFELAHGGTMFLDEIGEIPLNLQATLLRALQEGEIRKIGDDKVIPVNVRIIAATNEDLRDKARSGQFRMDLLYRLDVLSLSIPPLRERREDIALIARHYIKLYCRAYGKPRLKMGRDALDALKSHEWPGNTRELRNVCERLVVLGEDAASISADEVNGILALARTRSVETPGEGRTTVAEPVNLEQLVEFANSMRVNRADIAHMLGISRTTLWRRMNRGG